MAALRKPRAPHLFTKCTNDLVGHAGGDELLVNIALQLEQFFSPKDLYRIGGYEFLALYRNTDRIDLNQFGQQLIDSVTDAGQRYHHRGRRQRWLGTISAGR